MVTLRLSVTGKGALPKASGMLVRIAFLMWVHITYVCSPPHFELSLRFIHVFTWMLRLNIKSYMKEEISCSLWVMYFQKLYNNMGIYSQARFFFFPFVFNKKIISNMWGCRVVTSRRIQLFFFSSLCFSIFQFFHNEHFFSKGILTETEGKLCIKLYGKLPTWIFSKLKFVQSQITWKNEAFSFVGGSPIPQL